MLLQLPQYYRNYKTKSADALSPWFLAQWLLVSVDAAPPPHLQKQYSHLMYPAVPPAV